MAGPYYVRSTDGSDVSDGLSWANAKATLAGALAVAAAGERIWVSQVHAESQASAMQLTAGAFVEILCGNDAAEPPTALATTATITTTGANGITIDALAVIYGITFSVGTSGNPALRIDSGAVVFEACSFVLASGGSASLMRFGTSGDEAGLVFMRLLHCTVVFSHADQTIFAGCRWEMVGGALALTGTAPTILFTGLHGAIVRLQGVDLSGLGAGTALLGVTGNVADYRFEQCKLGAAVALTSGSHDGSGRVLATLDNSDSSDTQFRMQRNAYEGDVYSETTIVRTGGATNGVTGLSHKMVASAGSIFHLPLYGPELVMWNPSTGSPRTLTVEIVHDNVTNLQDDEVWVEVEYLGTSGLPRSLFAMDRATDILATPADQTASSATWTTTGLTNPNKQKLVVTFTPHEIGVIRARVALAKPSYTLYVCPKMALA